MAEIARVTDTLADDIAEAIDDDELPLAFGGDHALAMGRFVGRCGLPMSASSGSMFTATTTRPRDRDRRDDGIHVSLDPDWLDPVVAPGVGTPVRGGVEYRAARVALSKVAERDRNGDILRPMEVVEVNPRLDRDNRTAEVAAELAATALGKRRT